MKPDTSEKQGGQSECFGRRGKESSFIWRLVSAPFRSLLGRTYRGPLALAHSVSLPLPRPHNSKPKWGSKPHLRSLWLHSISPLISDPPHKLLSERGRGSGRASERHEEVFDFTCHTFAHSERRERASGRASMFVRWMDGAMQQRLWGGPRHRKERAAAAAAAAAARSTGVHSYACCCASHALL